MSYYLLLILLLGAGCSSKNKKNKELEELTPAELIKEAREMKKVNRTSALELYSKLENLYPDSEFVADSLFERGEIEFEKSKYPEALAIFEIFCEYYPDHAKFWAAKKYSFFCLYNVIRSYEQDLSLIIGALHLAYELLGHEKDEKIVQAYNRLTEFLEYKDIDMLNFSIQHSPKLWVQLIFVCARILESDMKKEFKAEGLFRLIELFVHQKEPELKKIAHQLFQAHKNILENTEWDARVQSLLK